MSAAGEATPGIRRTLFIQASSPIKTPYCSGSHMWRDTLDVHAGNRPVESIDLPGFGDGPLLMSSPSIESWSAWLAEHLASNHSDSVHVVAHDLAALVALDAAMDHPGRFSSLTIVSCPWLVPTGNDVENLALKYPPQPLWSRGSQAWTLARLCHSHLAADSQLLDAVDSAGRGAAHLSLMSTLAAPLEAAKFQASADRIKYKFFRRAREVGIEVPVQIIAGSDDPLTSIEHYAELFRIVGEHQSSAQFHLLNRCGNLPFLEQAEDFYRVVWAFHKGLLATR